MTDEPFKATDEDWRQIENSADNRYSPVSRVVLELRDRVAALEAERVAPKASTTAPTPQAAVPLGRELLGRMCYDAPGSIQDGLVVVHDHGFQHGLAAGRAEQGGTPEPEPDAPQTLRSVALGMVNTLRHRVGVTPQICDTIERAIYEQMAEQQAAQKPEPTHPPYISGHGLVSSEIKRALVDAGWPEPNQAPAGDEEPVKASAVETLRELVEVMHDAFFGNDSGLPPRVIQSVNNAHAFLFKLEHGPRLPVTACDGEAQR